jgi:hypothetical protein
MYCWLVFLLAGLSAPAGASDAGPGGDLEVVHTFDRSDYVVGEFGNITLDIRNICNEEVGIRFVRVQVDWGWVAGGYIALVPPNVVLAPGAGPLAFRVQFRVPDQTRAVDHTWNISVDYRRGASDHSNLTWCSGNHTDLRVSDYEVVVTPGSLTITAGQTASFDVGIWKRNGFNKTVELWYGAVRGNDYENRFWGQCYPGWIAGNGTSRAVLHTNSSTPAGRYSLNVQGACGDGHTFWGSEGSPGRYRHAEAFLEVRPFPQVAGITPNPAAQAGLGAILILAAVTGALFAVEARRKGGAPRS